MFSNLFKKSEEPKPDNKRIEGKIFHVSPKGYGFIITPEIKFTRVFFHWTALRPEYHFPDLEKGMQVEFEPEFVEGRGYRARNVIVLDGAKQNDEAGRDRED